MRVVFYFLVMQNLPNCVWQCLILFFDLSLTLKALKTFMWGVILMIFNHWAGYPCYIPDGAGNTSIYMATICTVVQRKLSILWADKRCHQHRTWNCATQIAFVFRVFLGIFV